MEDTTPTRYSAYVSLVLTAAIFGFFYAWVCSTMWGLDAADPRVAIPAMQEMNASVRNAVFFPAFFLTPIALAITGVLAWRVVRRRAAGLFLGAAAVYLVGGLILTMAINVPMNEELVQLPSLRPSRRHSTSGMTTPAVGRPGTSSAPCAAESV